MELYTVYVENGKHFVKLPNGEKMPNIIKTIVEDGCDNNPAIVTITVYCKLEE